MHIQHMSYHTKLFSSRYILGRYLGVGATSNVFECYKRDTKEKYAVKKTTTPNLNRFNISKKEEQYLKLVSTHPNICSLRDLFYEHTETKEYIKHIVTECGDDTLSNIASNVNMTETTLKPIVIQMLLSIMQCHNNSICHRDIKLENFIYTNNYNLSPESPMFLSTINIKLIDFGLATQFHKDYNLRGRVGTIFYVAPEILTLQSYTPKIDSWSLGVSIYKLIIKNPVIKHTKIESFIPTYDNKQWNNYSSNCHDFIKRLLTEDPTKRMSINEALNHNWVNVS
jgi:calcium-dependent protein kinase